MRPLAVFEPASPKLSLWPSGQGTSDLMMVSPNYTQSTRKKPSMKKKSFTSALQNMRKHSIFMMIKLTDAKYN